ncbi:TetR/AcrR family transcriptional regulator [Nocardioides bizhenqiangii]|uniref:TetR/AcrR family transcriptional regulator n=1 Tax=Nocardioides bizhenqiangii TaxID=3095076 RepID=A0ABZ0ZQG2_9ACTN|nr:MULTISPECIES: TetR/AcrR family transcriptional regulator [unclassified Nocardioides]MDZ5619520.1 TetR/AcrR family transcriptional regulator [Nocardioides sp. HM23]WQQ26463.1 TetR/AcrR family transcriptional regulator [Nocardioides sp. HM61]
MARDTRTRMIHGAALMIGTRGVGAMSLRDLAKEAGVPLGSTYHHFPGGRQQLVEEAVRTIGAAVTRRIEVGRERGPVAALDAFGDEWRNQLEATDFLSGCPVFAVATADDEALRDVATEVLESWQTTLAAVLADAGVDPGRTSRLAMFIVAAIEGAIALCQAEKSIGPLRDTMEEIHHLVDAAVGSR